ncbi:MAG: hypothetical protein JNN00_02900 [Chitinophagaceae bacterium]|nr:hypothetical protein [Chitinophagaceae bacterium]
MKYPELKVAATIITVYLLLFLSASGNSQGNKDEDIDLREYRPRFISLSSADIKITSSLPINEIEVFDVRFDTSNIGLLQNSISGKEKLIHIKGGTARAVTNNFRSAIPLPDPGNEPLTIALSCFIKKLFISDNIYIDDGHSVSSSGPSFEIKSGAMLILEFYAKQNGKYLPLYRFDSTVAGQKDIFHHGESYLSEILIASLRKLKSLNWEKLSSSAKFRDINEINTYNNVRFQLPILKETVKKGIYLRFEDFKKNKPLDTAFTVEKTKRGDFLYIRNNKGEDKLQTELWGYCDGKDAYIYSAENYFKLYRYDNTFMIYGAKDFTSVRKLRLNFGLLDMAIPNSNYAKAKTVNSYKLEFNLFQLDMDSGELY